MKQVVQNSLYLLWFFLLVIVPSESRRFQRTFQQDDEDDVANEQSRRGKFLPLFQVVTFPNDACSTGSRDGTCYTAAECSARGGTASGRTCANGFGVCCIFSFSCGRMSNENCTYFQTPTTIPTDTDCNLEVCPCSDNICQLRLDLENFVITGPSTDSSVTGATVHGNFVKVTGAKNGDALPVAVTGQCLTDIFSVTSPGNSAPPVVCGTLTGEHMYVDLNANTCDNLRFSFHSVGRGAAIVNRSWRIKVTQYSCDYNNLAPSGCTQYYFGSNTDQIMSFNFNNQHLADQDQNICIRREVSNCRICYVPTGENDFELSAPTASALPGNPDDSSLCCNYGVLGTDEFGFDCLEIPGVMGMLALGEDPLQSRFCGRKGFQLDNGGVPGIQRTVCSIFTPFSVRFRSDRYEFVSEGAISEGASPDAGFRLAFVMDSNGC